MRFFKLTTAVAALLAGACMISGTVALAAGTPEPNEPQASADSALGGYLAGRLARALNDTAEASSYLENALKQEPDNPILIEQAFLVATTSGDWAHAKPLAEKLVATEPTHRMANLVLAVEDFAAKDYSSSSRHFLAGASGTVGELTATLARAWALFAAGDADGAFALLDGNKPAEWPQFYLRYHKALIADLAGKTADARSNYERIFKLDPRTPRVALAYAQSLAHAGDLKAARAVLKENIDKSGGDGQPMVRALLDKLQSPTATAPLLIDSASAGMAEVFYGIGEALTAEGGVNIGTIYLQAALRLEPEAPFALAALANTYEQTRRYAEAIEIYDRMPRGTALQMAVDIRKAVNLDLLDRVDEAKSLLDRVVHEHPTELQPLDALGTIMRAHKRFQEAAEYYTRAINIIQKPDRRYWSYWYARGTCYERLKKWPLAEADLLKALQAYPDQPLVLNYLGYSWVDQNKNLKQGMAFIEKAVSLKPDDGYIVDSLGWAHYRQGNYAQAVGFLEHAVELRPEDPVLNDHLGDALWKVGRKLEATYQWQLALTLKPEPEDAETITQKLQNGLPSERPLAHVPAKARQAGKEQFKKKVETQTSPGGIWPFQ